MQYQKQGRDECWLASLAMLAGKSLDEVRSVAAVETGDSLREFNWSRTVQKLVYCPDSFHALSLKICSALGLPPLSIYYQHLVMLSNEPSTRPDLSGRGYISLLFIAGAHAIVYEDGLVFDPDREETKYGMDWESYVELREELGLPKIIEFKLSKVAAGAEAKYKQACQN